MFPRAVVDLQHPVGPRAVDVLGDHEVRETRSERRIRVGDRTTLEGRGEVGPRQIGACVVAFERDGELLDPGGGRLRTIKLSPAHRRPLDSPPEELCPTGTATAGANVQAGDEVAVNIDGTSNGVKRHPRRRLAVEKEPAVGLAGTSQDLDAVLALSKSREMTATWRWLGAAHRQLPPARRSTPRPGFGRRFGHVPARHQESITGGVIGRVRKQTGGPGSLPEIGDHVVPFHSQKSSRGVPSGSSPP